ncbi:hypothetical protein HanPI659440_Chr16g0644591 [Helianthus annuus]|nr:hypothetical protein HanPI659440_Chr16g0644591 [Helianthus annuus]
MCGWEMRLSTALLRGLIMKRLIEQTEQVHDFSASQFVLQMVFETKGGIGLVHFQMKDLETSVWIVATVVNRFASMFNFENVNRTKGT